MAGIAPMTSFPQGFAYGISLRGLPIAQANPGRTFFLGNSTTLEPYSIGASDGNPGTFYAPFSTLSGAFGFGTAGKGDVIYVLPGHAETISSSTALALNKSGVAIIGLGTGTDRPTFTLDTANTATITVSASNVSIQNCVFVGNFLAIAALFTLTTAKNFLLDSCEIRDTSSILNILNIVTTSTTTAANDGLTITNNSIFSSATSGAVNLLSALGTNARVTIANNNYAALTTGTGAVIPIATGKILTNALIDRNIFSLKQTTGVTTGILITTDGTTNSGMICRNLLQGLDATTEILVTASSGFTFSQNYYSGAADTSGYLLPAADS